MHGTFIQICNAAQPYCRDIPHILPVTNSIPGQQNRSARKSLTSNDGPSTRHIHPAFLRSAANPHDFSPTPRTPHPSRPRAPCLLWANCPPRHLEPCRAAHFCRWTHFRGDYVFEQFGTGTLWGSEGGICCFPRKSSSIDRGCYKTTDHSNSESTTPRTQNHQLPGPSFS